MEKVCPLCKYAYGLEEPKQEPPFAVSNHFLAAPKEEAGYIQIFYKKHDAEMMFEELKKKEIVEDLEKCVRTAIKKMDKKNGESDYRFFCVYNPNDKSLTEESHGYFVLMPIKDDCGGCGGCGGNCGGCDKK